jgi:hypothetical protein
MARPLKKAAHYPVRCPGCEGVVHLPVGDSQTIRLFLHNVRACNKPFHYRCWRERGFPLPRVEFLADANAMSALMPAATPMCGERGGGSGRLSDARVRPLHSRQSSIIR